MIRRLGALAGAAALVAVGLPVTANAVPASGACDTRVNNTVAKLLECVTVEGVREHQAELHEHDPETH